MMYKSTKTLWKHETLKFWEGILCIVRNWKKAIGSEYNSKMFANRVKVRCCIFIYFESVCKAVKFKPSQVLKKE